MGGVQSHTQGRRETKPANESLSNNSPWPNLVSPGASSDPVHDTLNNERQGQAERCSEDEERESYRSWLSSPRGAETTPRCSFSSAGSGPRPSLPSSTMSKPSSKDDSLSSGWLGTRPSADTPLHPSVDASKTIATMSSLRPRASASSAGGDTVSSLSAGASARSSFALERASLEANRMSLEAFQGAFAAQHAQHGDPQAAFSRLEDAEEGAVTIDMLMSMVQLPPEQQERFAALGALPPQTPAPASMLAKLWGERSDAGVARGLNALAARGVVTIARLPTGHVWALPQEQHILLLQSACRIALPGFHARLVDAYAATGNPTAPVPLATAPDDGYLVANIGHHLVGAGRLETARALLFDLSWLERKLRATSAAAVVADFRRYLMLKPERAVKLVLEAFQMSAGLAMALPEAPGLLRTLIVGRLMAVPLSPDMKAWAEAQRRQAAASTILPRPLLPLTPSLDQAGGLQRLALKGHRGAITRVLLTPTGTEVVSCGTDGSCRLWDLEIGDCVLGMEGHAGPVTAAAITADGSLLLTASEDGTARAHELEKGQCLRVLAGDEGPIAAMALDPAGRFVITGAADGALRIWDLATARAQHVIPTPGGVSALALSPDARYVLSAGGDGALRICDVATGAPMGVMEGHARGISAVVITPDGNRALSASHDGTARVWSLRSGRCLAVLDRHVGRINTLAMSLDGATAATGGDDGLVCVWDVRSGDCRRVLSVGSGSWVCELTLFPGGDRLLAGCGDGTAVVWSLDSGEVVRELQGHSRALTSVAVTRRGRFAVTGSEDGAVRVWDLSAPENSAPKSHEGRVRTLAAADGVIAATAGDDCVVRLWDPASREFRGALRAHAVPIRWAQFSSDGARLITASPDRHVCVWDAASCELLHSLPPAPGSRVKSFAASGDLSTAAVCLFDSTVTVWDVAGREPCAALQRRGERDAAKGHTSAVNQLLMSAGGATVITLAKDATARVWDVATATCRAVLAGHTDGLGGGCLSNENHLLATYSYDGTVRVWSLDGAVGTCTARAVLHLPGAAVQLALTRGGDRLAAALDNGTVALADLGRLLNESENGSAAPSAPTAPTASAPLELPALCLRVHTDEVTGLSFSADGALLATVSQDGTAALLDSATGAVAGRFIADCGLTCCHLDAAAECLVAGTERGVVHFIDTAGAGEWTPQNGHGTATPCVAAPALVPPSASLA